MNVLRKASIFSAALAALVLIAPCAPAQTIYGVDSLGGFGVPLAVELTGPPAGPCAYPSGPMAGYPAFAAAAGGCPSPLPFVSGWPGLNGDITLDLVTDTVWIAGVNQIAAYTTAGVQLTGFNVPINVTGLGFDCVTASLWVSSAGSYRRLIPGCGAPALGMGPFPNPMPGALTDLDWDPVAGTVWACTSTGFVGYFPPGAGAPVCAFNVAGLGLALPLTGLALDRTVMGPVPGNRAVFVTDGLQIARLDAGASCATGIATLAGATFTFPTNPVAVASGPLSGLAFSAHGVRYGAGAGPTISLVGNAIVGGAPMLTMTGAMPGTAALFVNVTAALCPPMPGPGGALLYAIPTFIIAPIAHGGTVSLTLPLPAGALGLGTPIYLQYLNLKAGGGIEATVGLRMTIAHC